MYLPTYVAVFVLAMVTLGLMGWSVRLLSRPEDRGAGAAVLLAGVIGATLGAFWGAAPGLIEPSLSAVVGGAITGFAIGGGITAAFANRAGRSATTTQVSYSAASAVLRVVAILLLLPALAGMAIGVWLLLDVGPSGFWRERMWVGPVLLVAALFGSGAALVWRAASRRDPRR